MGLVVLEVEPQVPFSLTVEQSRLKNLKADFSKKITAESSCWSTDKVQHCHLDGKPENLKSGKFKYGILY